MLEFDLWKMSDIGVFLICNNGCENVVLDYIYFSKMGKEREREYNATQTP